MIETKISEVVLELGIKKVAAFLIEQGTLLGGLRQEVQFINDEFGHMKAFLEQMDAFNQQNQDPQLGEWIRQVRDVSYDTQDILDEFSFRFAPHRLTGFLGSMRRWTFEPARNLPARHQLASKLQSVKARIINIAESRARYESHYAGIISQVPRRVAASTASRKDDALLVEEAQLVGIDNPKQLLISQLLEDAGSQLKAIAVVGMGGLGKTTLARKMYEDDAVKRHFPIRAWVAVSQNCDIRNLLSELIQQIVGQFKEQVPLDMHSMDSLKLKEKVKGFLQQGRYAIVFDDVWGTEFWDEMMFVLPKNSYGGNRVIFTTRIADVANACSRESNGCVYRMPCLNVEDSWALFCMKIFKGRDCPAELEDVAKSIVGRCGGLPLGILAIGGLLASKDESTSSKEWELIRDRLCDEFEGTGKFGQLNRIFSLTYNDLPSTLKACLLYTSLFPLGDKNMSAGYLVRLFVAEGFVEPKGAQTAEESAWDCLKELANRSLIQPVDIRYNGKFVSITIHDLVRDFIGLKSTEQNMVTLLSSTEQISEGWHPEKVVRRLVFDRSLLEIPSIELKKCRSIINFGNKKPPSKAILATLLSSSLLTVVDLRGIDLEEIPEGIFKLLQLKVLCISGKRITTVPKSIHRLQNLQFLFLPGTSIRELPVEIRKLRKLCHLELYVEQAQDSHPALGYSGFKAPGGMGELVELQTLHAIDAAGMMSEIGKLTKLRTLCITNVRREDGQELCTSLNNLNSLEELVVAASVQADEAASFNLNHPIDASSLQSLCLLQLSGCLDNIPSWIRNLRGLGIIALRGSKLAEDPLETLQHLPNLFRVRLDEAYIGESLCFKAGHFLKLKDLRLIAMKALRWVSFEKGAMPGINRLTLGELPLLKELPVGVQHLRQLQELDLWSMNPQLTEKLESGAGSEDIEHIPQATIRYYSEGRWESKRLSRKKKEYHVVPTVGVGFSLSILSFAFAIFYVVLATLLSFKKVD